MLTLDKPTGFMWYFPGVYSIMVPYWDILDFFYSGHISTAIIFAYAFYGLHKMYPSVPFYRCTFIFYAFFKLIYCWIMMIFTRTHFTIDMTFGLAFAYLSTRVGEALCYYPDVLLCGLKDKDRHMMHYRACPKCGWMNEHALKVWISEEEKLAQAKIYRPENFN